MVSNRELKSCQGPDLAFAQHEYVGSFNDIQIRTWVFSYEE